MKQDLRASLKSLKAFADSFKGLEEAAVRKQLKGAVIKRKRWGDKDKEYSGKGLVAVFPRCEVRVLFYGKSVCMTSVQILSD